MEPTPLKRRRNGMSCCGGTNPGWPEALFARAVHRALERILDYVGDPWMSEEADAASAEQRMVTAILTGDGHLVAQDGSMPVVIPGNTGGWAQYGAAAAESPSPHS